MSLTGACENDAVKTPSPGRRARGVVGGRLCPVLLASTVVTSAGCGRGEATREWAGQVLDSAGVRFVHNPAEGLWCPDEAWTFAEALSIGGDDGDPAQSFGAISGIQVAEDGAIFVLDPMAGEVRVFGPGGAHRRTIGARGQGPGEFSRGVAGLFLTDDERVVLPDLGNRRVTWMERDGTVRGSISVDLARGFPVRWDWDSRGGVVVQRRAMGFNQDPVLETGEPLVRIDSLGQEETLLVMPRSQVVWMEGAAPRFRYFSTEPSWDLGPDGLLRWGMTQEYRVEVRDPDGALRLVFTRPVPALPLTGADQDRFRTLLRAALERAGTSPESIERMTRRLEFGGSFPAFNRMMGGPDGTTLVQQVAALEDLESIDLAEEMSRRLGGTGWDVFDRTGRYLGAVELPSRFTPMAWTTNAVYGRWMDDLDRSYVKKLTMTRPRGEGCAATP